MAVEKKSGRKVTAEEGDANLHRRGDGLGTGKVGTGGRGEGNSGVTEEQAKEAAAAAAAAAASGKEGEAKPKPAGKPSGNGAKPGQGQSAANDADDRGLLDDLASLSGLTGSTGSTGSTSTQQQSGGIDLSSLLGGGSQQQTQQQSGGIDLSSLLGGGSQQQSSSSSGSGIADLLGAALSGGSQQNQQSQNQQSGLSGLTDLLTGGSSSGSSGSSSGSSGSSGGSGGTGTPLTGLFGGGSGSSGSSSSSGSSGSGKKISLIKIILFVIAAIIIFSLLSKMCSSNNIDPYTGTADELPVVTQTQPAETKPAETQPTVAPSSEAQLPSETEEPNEEATYYSQDIQEILAAILSGNGAGSLSGLSGGTSASAGSTSTDLGYNTWDQESINTNTLNTTVPAVSTGIREKYTKLAGNGNDSVLIMVYMCGTDLESKYGCATSDMQEMLAANAGDNVNILIYTGGCKKWKNSVMSSSVNQIYQIKGRQLYLLEKDMGSKSMVDPATLTEFIKYCSSRYQATRKMLIFWDHGGGSVSGYGYDEKNARQGSMSLAGVNTALANAGVQFDMVGFDACLMATAETALMLDKYADYMVASEESEPGIGWYYTDWLTKLGSNTSIPTAELGKNICDSFVSVCGSKARGQSATLSVIDVAEFAGTVPAALSKFSKSTTELITNNNYQTVAKARSGSREFARSSKIDQIDLVDFLNRLGTDDAKALKSAILSAVKYNTTSSDMTNCYGVSIYFPYSSTRTVSTAVATYDKIGLDSEYSKCIQEFASMGVSGSSIYGGGAGSSTDSLLSLLGGGQNSSAGYSSSGDISSLLGALLGGDYYSGRALTLEQTAEYIYEHQFDAGYLNWVESGDEYIIYMPEDQWQLVTDIALSTYYNDGEGYIDLGVDCVYRFDDNGNLAAPEMATVMTIGGQGVSYYYLDSASDGTNYAIHGYVPALLNGELVRLMITFDNEHESGVIVGAIPVYDASETEQVAKNVTLASDDEAAEAFECVDENGEPVGEFQIDEDLLQLKEGDKLEFVCDYYTYEGEYVDSFLLGDPVTYTADIKISNTKLEDGYANLMYRFTDIYNQIYWSEAILY